MNRFGTYISHGVTAETCVMYIHLEVQFSSNHITGIGSIPDAVLAQLGDHKNLGVHSEMFSDGVVELVEQGCITNAEKAIQTGKIVSSFAIGTRKLYDFMHNNPFVGEHLCVCVCVCVRDI